MVLVGVEVVETLVVDVVVPVFVVVVPEIYLT